LKPRLHLLVLVATLLPGAFAATNSLTTNLVALNRFFDAFEMREGPVRVLAFGDSMSDSYQSIASHLIRRMMVKRPFAGISFNNAFNRSMVSATNGATLEPPSSLWFSYTIKVPAGASAHWENQQDSGGVLADRIGLYWISQAGGGDFDLMISEQGGEWTKVASLNGRSALPEGSVTNITVPLSKYRVQVKSVSGVNYVLEPELVNSTAKGLHAGWLDYAGIRLQQVSGVPRAIRVPILRAFRPDLIIWHFKEGGSAIGMREALEENEAWFKATVPEAEVLYIGTPYSEDAVGGADTVAENHLVRDFAVSQGRAFVDCMTPGGSYEWLRDHGYMQDVIHPNNAGGAFLASAAWDDLGFLALGLHRRLTLERASPSFILGATLAPGFIYSFEQSTNVMHWETFHFRTNEAGEVELRLRPAEPVRQYRMRVQPME
jgi:hypothetical protein